MESKDLLSTNVKWFKSLVPKKLENGEYGSRDLMSSVSEKELNNGLIICGITWSDTHIFALFPNYISFAKFHLSLPEEKRCFFEIIPGDRIQKPHFDLDFSYDDYMKNYPASKLKLEEFLSIAETLFNTFLQIVIPLFEKLYAVKVVLASDILIFTSHGPRKRSFHLIIDNYAHLNNREAKAFYEEVSKVIPEELKEFLDSAVYSKTQQFRIVGSQKRGSDRPKKILEEWIYQEEKITFQYKEPSRNDGHRLVLLLEASLVSYTGNCKLLSNLLPEEARKETTWNCEVDDLHPETVKAAFALLGKKAGVNVNVHNFPYEIRHVVGGLIMLKRRYPSMCQVCKRIHEHENPFMFVITDDNNLRHVYFDCRRGDGRRLYLGILPEEINGKYLPDSPHLLEAQEILSKMIELSKLSMRTVRKAKA